MEPTRPLFRTEVLERFARARREPVWPRWVEPRAVRVVWCLVALTLIAGCLAWSVELPRLVPARAIVVRVPDTDQLALALLTDARDAAGVRRGDRVKLENGAQAVIASVESRAHSPFEIVERWQLDGARAASIERSAVVAFASFEQPPEELALGHIVDARIELEGQPALTLLPVIGAWFQREP